MLWGRAASLASFDVCISLSRLLSAVHPLTLSCWRAAGRMHICAAHFCLFSCLCANICTPSGNKKADLHMPSCPIYWCSVTYRTSFSQSPQALPITYLQCALSSEYPLMQTELRTVTLLHRIHVRLSVFHELSNSLHRHQHLQLYRPQRQFIALKWAFSPLRTCLCESAVSSHSSSAHHSTQFIQIIDFTHVWFEKSCGAFKQLFRHTHAALDRQHTAVEKGYKHFIWIIDASCILYTTHGIKNTLLCICKVYWGL